MHRESAVLELVRRLSGLEPSAFNRIASTRQFALEQRLVSQPSVLCRNAWAKAPLHYPGTEIKPDANRCKPTKVFPSFGKTRP